MKGRKRHIVVDVLGLVLGCYVSAANVADVKAAPGVLVWVLEMYQRIAFGVSRQGISRRLWGITRPLLCRAGTTGGDGD